LEDWVDSGQASEDADPSWFQDYDELVEGDPYSVADNAFLAVLRARAATRAWPCPPRHTFASHDDELGQPALRVGVYLDDPAAGSQLLIAFGAVFDGQRVIGGRIDYLEPFYFERRCEPALEFSGSIEALAQRAGEWFEWLLTLPIERRDWFNAGELAYREWVFPHTGETLHMLGPGGGRPVRPPDQVVLVHGTAGPESGRV
jgi:hypothetical protein